MATLSQSHRIPLLSQILILQIGAFMVYHLSLALVFDIRWVTLGLEHRFLVAINWCVEVTALHGPALVLVWIALRNLKYVVPILAVAGATAYSAYYWSYPVLTGFLYGLGQFDRFPEFLFSHVPGIDQYPPL